MCLFLLLHANHTGEIKAKIKSFQKSLNKHFTAAKKCRNI